MAQDAGVEIALALIWIDQCAVIVERHRVDRQVAARQVLLERDVRRGVRDESLVTGRRFALGARQRVLLVRFRMQEHRKILADRLVSERRHLLRRRADHDPITVGFQRCVQITHVAAGAAEQLIAYEPSDPIRFQLWTLSLDRFRFRFGRCDPLLHCRQRQHTFGIRGEQRRKLDAVGGKARHHRRIERIGD